MSISHVMLIKHMSTYLAPRGPTTESPIWVTVCVRRLVHFCLGGLAIWTIHLYTYLYAVHGGGVDRGYF